MSDPTTVDELAQLARTAVCLPAQATLEVDGARPMGPGYASVGLAERDGLPTFHCAPGSPLVESAQSAAGAVLVVRTESGGRLGPRVRLVGSLVVAGTDHAVGTDVVLVQLRPLRISVHEHEHDRSGLLVPLDAYDRTDRPAPDFDTVAEQIVAHSNHSHGSDLRGFIARRHHLDDDEIAAAELTALDEWGAVVSWIDQHGAHRTEVPFDGPVTCPHLLADTLRVALEG